MSARGWVCAECGFEQETSDPCGACRSVRTVLASVIQNLIGANWRESFDFDTVRPCQIEHATVESKSEHGRGRDAAYDLLDFKGSPRHVAARIAEWLEGGAIGDAPDDGRDMILTVRVRVSRATGATGLPKPPPG